MEHKSWDKLPIEILLCIFHYLKCSTNTFTDIGLPVSNTDTKITDIVICQLVCKGWSKAAQRLIYQDVKLGGNVSSFVRTITADAPQLASLVKVIAFSETIMEVSDCSNLIESILNNCPQIEKLLVNGKDMEQLIWPWILMEDIKLENLKTISTETCGNIIDTTLYSLLALKLRKTLTGLVLSLSKANDQRIARIYNSNPQSPGYFNGKEDFSRLIKRLTTFSSLKKLTITNCQPSAYIILDQVLNDCPKTTLELNIKTLRLLKWNGAQENIKPNSFIKTLRVDFFILDEVSLLYLAYKFKALESLFIQSLEYKPKEEANKEVFWDQLTQLCSSVKIFDIVMKYEAFGLQVTVEKCMELLIKMGCDTRYIHISLMSSSVAPGRHNHVYRQPRIIQINKFGLKSCGLLISGDAAALGDTFSENIASWIQSFCPSTIDFNHADLTLKYHKMFTIYPEEHSRLKPYFDFNSKSDIRQFFTKQCNSKNWEIFNSIISSANIDRSEMHSMVLPNKPPLLSNYDSSSIRHLELHSSILHEMVFPKISMKLPTLNELVLNTNCYLMDNSTTLKIFFPSTQLDLLVLLIGPTCDNTTNGSMNYHHRTTNVKCTLENLDLLAAISSTGYYLLKIETEAKTYISKRQGNKIIEKLDSNTEDVAAGTNEDFLIWIKFKELKKIAIHVDSGHLQINQPKSYELLE